MSFGVASRSGRMPALAQGFNLEACADADDLILGVSFATKNQVLLDTVQIAQPGVASASKVDHGTVVKTYPITQKRPCNAPDLGDRK